MSRFAQPLACVVFTLLTSTVFADPGNWAQWRGPTRDGQLPVGQLPDSLSDLKQVWKRQHGPSYSGPVVCDGVLYTTETVDKAYEKVTAYDLETGDVLWTRQWKGSLAVPFFAAANGDWIRSTPACSEDGLVVVGMRDTIHCLDPKTGDSRWTLDVPASMKSPLPMFGAVCSPLIDGDSVYVQTGGATVKLRMGDGSVVWKTLDNADAQYPGAFSSPVIKTICGVRQLVVQTRAELCGVDLSSGNVLWRQPIEAFRGMNILTPLVIGDRVFTSAHSGKAQWFKITRQDSQWSIRQLWQQKQQAYMSSPVFAGGKILLHLKNERFTALDPETGASVFTTRPMAKYVSMITDGQRVLALTDGGKLMLIDVTGETFSLLEERGIANDSWAHVAIDGDALIVRDLEYLAVYRW
jgi:outer membrane protein assembly factor BamB